MEGDVTQPRLIRLFEESEQATWPARRLAERDTDYYHHKQWTAEEEKELKKRGQPVVTFNRIQRKADYIFGLEKQLRKDPKAFPRTPGDDQAAAAATDALRFVCDDSDWDMCRSAAMEDIYIPGTGAVMVGAKMGRDGQIDPDLIQIPWDRFFADPHSRKIDFSDAAYMGIITWYDLDEAVAKWPDAEAVLTATVERTRGVNTYDDRPKWRMWADYDRKRVRVVEGYYRVSGTWMMCIATEAGEIIPTMPSPYLDDEGNPENPIKAVSYYVDRDNNRYGGVRAMISPQDEINKRRSKGLHLTNMRQSRVSRGAGMEPEDVRRELSKADGVVVGEKDEFEIIPTSDMASANLQLLQEAKNEIDLLGPNAALAGKNEQSMSGRAIIAQQQGGMVEANMLFDRLRVLSLAVYRSIWGRIRQYWTAPRWLRITEDERDVRFVGINRPVTFLELAQRQLANDPNAQLKLGLLAQDPRSHMIATVENNVGELEVDITIDEGMDTPTVEAEQFDMLTKVLPSATQLPPPLFKTLIMASSLRDKDKILEMLDQPPPAPPPEAAARQQITDQVQLEAAKAGIEKTRSETARNVAKAGIEAAKTDQMMNAAHAARAPLDHPIYPAA
jgi:hypothetical protein